jgi:hypothetical protein
VLLDIDVPDGSGFGVAAQLVTKRQRAGVLIGSSCNGDEFEQLAAGNGAVGFVRKDAASAAKLDRLSVGHLPDASGSASVAPATGI